LVTFHVLHYAHGQRWGGFRRFALLQQKLKRIPGLRFGKAMGCGQGAVFSVKPDWSRYAYLFQWENEAAAKEFFAGKQWQEIEGHATQNRNWHLQPIHAKGLWDGKPRFQEEESAPLPAETTSMAVITRADLKPWKFGSFGKYAQTATDALAGHLALQYSLGMGELPFVRQATFSVWDSAEAMKAYAYKTPEHREAMKGKKKHDWYGEEMYARFGVLGESEKGAEGLFSQLG
jgi:heme-degrading monooxygenase HmoA